MSDAGKVHVRRRGHRFAAEAVLDLADGAQTAWHTFTDYAAPTSQMPGIRSGFAPPLQRIGAPA